MVFNKKLPVLTVQQMNLLIAILVAIFYNTTFYHKLYVFFIEQGLGSGILLFLSVCAIHISLNFILLSIFAVGRFQKPILIFILCLSATIAYFTNTYGVIIDRSMILNVANTDKWEVFDLFTFKLFLYLLLMGVLPSVLVGLWPVSNYPWQVGLTRTSLGIVVAFSILILNLVFNSNFYASFFREHKELRLYINPIQALYSVTTYVAQAGTVKASEPLKIIGKDAQVDKSDKARDLVIFVLGEAARAQNLSLNGYVRQTNPLLSKEDVVSLGNMYSCGTSTAVSVPCMFSIFGRDAYSHKKFTNTENLADVLFDTGQIDVLWRDNNSNSKGVATRVNYQDYKTNATNKVCDEECRDIGMLGGLKEYIESSVKKDIFIVLHQMGNHGPAYYKRYPKDFEKFKPTCQTSELQQCSKEEIVNAYDNAILYTDYFLAQTIALLKTYDHQFETALFYVSDHGESLGENDIYLHGLPYNIAPEEQRKVGAAIWLGKGMRAEIDYADLKNRSQSVFNHDYIFHTILGLFEVQTPIYQNTLDILHPSKIAKSN